MSISNLTMDKDLDFLRKSYQNYLLAQKGKMT